MWNLADLMDFMKSGGFHTKSSKFHDVIQQISREIYMKSTCFHKIQWISKNNWFKWDSLLSPGLLFGIRWISYEIHKIHKRNP